MSFKNKFLKKSPFKIWIPGDIMGNKARLEHELERDERDMDRIQEIVKDKKNKKNKKNKSPYTKTTDPVKKPTGPITPSTQAEYMEREVWNKVQEQDRIKSIKDQIKDLEQDIVKLKSRNNPGDRNRIQKLTQEIKRLKSK